jgi:hypothetical protein
MASICASDRAPERDLGRGGGAGSEPPRIRGAAFQGLRILPCNSHYGFGSIDSTLHAPLQALSRVHLVEIMSISR